MGKVKWYKWNESVKCSYCGKTFRARSCVYNLRRNYSV